MATAKATKVATKKVVAPKDNTKVEAAKTNGKAKESKPAPSPSDALELVSEKDLRHMVKRAGVMSGAKSAQSIIDNYRTKNRTGKDYSVVKTPKLELVDGQWVERQVSVSLRRANAAMARDLADAYERELLWQGKAGGKVVRLSWQRKSSEVNPATGEKDELEKPIPFINIGAEDRRLCTPADIERLSK